MNFRPDQLDADPILRYFDYTRLPEPLRTVSASFSTLAEIIVDGTPRNPERTVALRKLLEAKDAAVRANIDAVPTRRPETFYDRLLAESKALEEKREKLAGFFGTESFLALDDYQQRLLRSQDTVMTEYAEILGRRIAGLTPPPTQRETFEQVGDVKIIGGDKTEEPIPFS